MGPRRFRRGCKELVTIGVVAVGGLHWGRDVSVADVTAGTPNLFR